MLFAGANHTLLQNVMRLLKSFSAAQTLARKQQIEGPTTTTDSNDIS